jgi:hypothetical protein
MVMRKTKRGTEWIGENPYQLPEIPDHLWIALNLSLAEATSQKDFDERIRNFCECFDIPRGLVALRFKQEERAMAERPHMTVH